MSRKTWQIDRRTFLKGTGVAVAVPYLNAMERAVGAQEPIKRICFVSFPNGASMPKEHDPEWGQWRWFPHDPGTDYEFTEVLSSLAPLRSKFSLMGGLSHPLSRELLGHLAGDTWLTAGDMRGDVYKNRVSVDQVAARHLERHTRYPSLVLSTDGGVGYKSRVSTLSFDHSGRPIPSEHRQRLIFERYFSPDGGASTAARRKSLRQGKKIVDLVLEDSKRLQKRLGKADQEKLDQYLASLSSVEAQVRRNEAWLDKPMKPFDSSHIDFDVAANVDPAGYLRSMFDLMVLGLETDLTRVMTYQTGREDGMGFADQFPNRALGIKRGHHTISHDQHKGHWEQWGRYDQWHAKQFGYFLQRLNEIRDGEHSLLDNTMVLYGSCCSTTHNARNYPLLLAGGGQMGLKHGQYVKYDEATPFSNVFVGMLNAIGCQTEAFADSTGTLPEIFG
ncbi:MAG: DUF1552 domain-containing protein [Planctomycetota bacterium]|nr:DUF1552 domain-containing protein [Planctomycetota bacterium]